LSRRACGSKGEANTLRWVTKETSESDYEFDLFLSYSSRDRDQARAVVRAAKALTLTVFQDEKNVQPGAVWAEEIRRALVNSREMALLVSHVAGQRMGADGMARGMGNGPDDHADSADGGS
jgi:TIR domain